MTSETPAEALAALRALDRAHGGLPVPERRACLRALQRGLAARAPRIVAAIDADFGGRAAEETLLAELLCVIEAARHAAARVAGWARPRRVWPGLPFWPARARIVPQPKGVVAILSPWNYPVQLALSPLIGAVAAGNRAVLKPSEATPRAAAELAALVEDCLGGSVARVVEGGPEVAAAMTALPFDHLLFTGGGERGRAVMRAAARHLVPLTLELGGKCWAIVTGDADLDRAARALVQGKALNAGQTCIAPDTVLLVGVERAAFVAAMGAAHALLFPRGLPTRLLGPGQEQRIAGLALDAHLQPLLPPRTGSALALAFDLDAGHPLLEEEVFGPVLPVLETADLAAALDWIGGRPSPLAIYLFSRDPGAEAMVLARSRAGALVVNGTVLQAAIEGLPFGGIGASGFGRYHGRAGFETFSNLRAHVRAPRRSLAGLADPPWDGAKRRLIERLVRMRGGVR